MAPTGHSSTQAPQSTQDASSTTQTPSFTERASEGHASAHTPQPKQSSAFTEAAMLSSPFIGAQGTPVLVCRTDRRRTAACAVRKLLPRRPLGILRLLRARRPAIPEIGQKAGLRDRERRDRGRLRRRRPGFGRPGRAQRARFLSWISRSPRSVRVPSVRWMRRESAVRYSAPSPVATTCVSQPSSSQIMSMSPSTRATSP